ncbi:MAG: ABC transporter ATP-binding protein [Planctomycetota bacterium]
MSAKRDMTVGPSDTTLVVECERLSKSYGAFRALSDCTMQVRKGDVFGLLGPNGAGKTTLIRSLLGFLKTTGGQARVCGADPQADSVLVRQNVSYLPGDARLPTHLRGDGVLRFFAEIHPLGDLQRSREIADILELDTRRRVGFMSTGMRQKLALAVVLAPQTPLLVLDEPTANLDPSVRATVLELVRDAHQAGRTVMFSSHVLSEIEETCNRVVFLRKGVLAHELEMSELFQRHRIWAEALGSKDPLATAPEALRHHVELHRLGPENEEGIVPLRIETTGDLSPLMPWLGALGLRRMRIEPLGLRAVYDAVHQDALEDLNESLRPMELAS